MVWWDEVGQHLVKDGQQPFSLVFAKNQTALRYQWYLNSTNTNYNCNCNQLKITTILHLVHHGIRYTGVSSAKCFILISNIHDPESLISQTRCKTFSMWEVKGKTVCRSWDLPENGLCNKDQLWSKLNVTCKRYDLWWITTNKNSLPVLGLLFFF